MPQGEYPRIANKDEILRMYDRTMMNYVNFLAKLIDKEYKNALAILMLLLNLIHQR